MKKIITIFLLIFISFLLFGNDKKLSEGDLMRICQYWFDDPYEYMFDEKAAISINNRNYGVYLGGIKGIVLYGGINSAMKKIQGSKSMDFYNLGPIETLANIKVYLVKSDSLNNFKRYNPAIIQWGYKNLIPNPEKKIHGIPCREIYSKIFYRFFRLMTESYAYAKSRDYSHEQMAYLESMENKEFDGLAYLEKRYEQALKHYALKPNGTVFTPQMAIGFWIRRGIDKTDGEFWNGLKKVMLLYDRHWFEEFIKDKKI